MRKSVVYMTMAFCSVASLVACQAGSVRDMLDDVDTYIYERPDSALAVLRSVDISCLNTRSLQAKYSLLYAMALDKNYIDTTDVSVVMPAVEYYRKHGTPDEKMRAYYYLGRIYLNSKDINAAAIAYSLSEKQAPKANDSQAEGLLYMNFADVYNEAGNLQKEEEYVRKGIQAFTEAGDSKHQNLTHGRLAIVLYTKKEWAEADSLFKVGIERASTDTVAMSLYLSYYARMKVLQPDVDSDGAIAMLNRKRQDYKRPFSLSDYAVYAYASLLNGDESTCKSIESNLLKLNDKDKSKIYSWLCKIEHFRGNDSVAYAYSQQSLAYNMDLARELISHSVTQALQDYYETESETAKKEARIKMMGILLGAAIFILMMLVVFDVLKRRRDRRHAETERMLRIAEESSRILKENFDVERQDLLERMDSYSRQIDKVRSDEAELSATLESLRKAYAVTYKEKFAAIGELCDAYMAARDRADKTDYMYRRVEKLIAYISDDDKLHRKFEGQINRDLNDIIRHLKEDLGNVDKKESRFICYCIVGFNPEMIATILGLSLSNVYSKKSRLKKKIREMDSPYREDYLQML